MTKRLFASDHRLTQFRLHMRRHGAFIGDVFRMQQATRNILYSHSTNDEAKVLSREINRLAALLESNLRQHRVDTDFPELLKKEPAND